MTNRIDSQAGTTPTPKLMVRLILEQDDHVVALKRRKKIGGGYGLVGGTVCKNESLKDALVRETFEEIGVMLDKDMLQLVHVMQRFKKITQTVSMVFFFRYHAKPQTLSVREANKFKEVVWLPLNNLPQNMSASLVEGMTSAVRGINYSEIIV